MLSAVVEHKKHLDNEEGQEQMAKLVQANR